MQNRHLHGFPAKTECDSLFDLFFTQVMPQILDVTELKVTMSIFYLLSHKQDYPPFVRYEELLAQTVSMPGIDEQALRRALDLAVNHGSILRLNLNIDGERVEAYFANIESDREAINNIEHSGVTTGKEGTGQALQQSNIFALYEQNIGIITPMIAEELKEAEKLYPAQWIEEALKEAVVLNKRSWKYVARILERWASEGKDSGEYRQGVKKGSPDKYIKGKYGHLVKR